MKDRPTKYAGYEHSEISNLIFQAFFTVYNEVGYCFEKLIYENSLIIELQDLGLNCIHRQKKVVSYKKQEVGTYLVDIIVENKIMLQIQTNEKISISDEKKLYQYLRACELEIGFVLNFGYEPTYKRKSCSTEHKHRLKTD